MKRFVGEYGRYSVDLDFDVAIVAASSHGRVTAVTWDIGWKKNQDQIKESATALILRSSITSVAAQTSMYGVQQWKTALHFILYLLFESPVAIPDSEEVMRAEHRTCCTHEWRTNIGCEQCNVQGGLYKSGKDYTRRTTQHTGIHSTQGELYRKYCADGAWQEDHTGRFNWGVAKKSCNALIIIKAMSVSTTISTCGFRGVRNNNNNIHITVEHQQEHMRKNIGIQLLSYLCVRHTIWADPRIADAVLYGWFRSPTDVLWVFLQLQSVVDMKAEKWWDNQWSRGNHF